MINFLTFRANALSSLSLLKKKTLQYLTKNEIEKWIKKEYERHYPVSKNETLPDTVWNDPTFIQTLENKALEDHILTNYENGIEQG